MERACVWQPNSPQKSWQSGDLTSPVRLVYLAHVLRTRSGYISQRYSKSMTVIDSSATWTRLSLGTVSAPTRAGETIETSKGSWAPSWTFCHVARTIELHFFFVLSARRDQPPQGSDMRFGTFFYVLSWT